MLRERATKRLRRAEAGGDSEIPISSICLFTTQMAAMSRVVPEAASFQICMHAGVPALGPSYTFPGTLARSCVRN